MSTGLEPSLICFIPSSNIDVASSVEVVVPSPTSLADLIDTFLTNSAPIDSVWSSNSLKALATVTPSFVTLSSPIWSLINTVLPAGPRVETTLLFNFWTPSKSLFFNSFPKLVSVMLVF